MHHNLPTEIAKTEGNLNLWYGQADTFHYIHVSKIKIIIIITCPQVRGLDSITGHISLRLNFTLVLETSIYVS